jgi:metal-responsive CopG/Arc/MetJ family transcriptional regulator
MGNSISSRPVGRKKLYKERITLPLSAEMLAEIDAALVGDEVRLDLIRAAIAAELERRQAQPPTSK